MLSGARRRIRERQLSGDGRAGSWARTKVRRRQWHYIRNQWRFFAGTVVGATAITSLILVFVRAEFIRGIIVGAAGAGTIGALAMLLMLVTGTGPIAMGATAEQWTAAELRPLKRTGWRVLNHFALRTWDIDHVLVGPGGVMAVETKWSSNGWTLDPPDPVLNHAIDQSARNARSLRLWNELRSLGVDRVTPVVFLWGSGHEDSSADQEAPQQVRGVTVVHGVHAARVWRTAIEGEPTTHSYDASQVQRMWDALDRHAQIRDSHERRNAPPSPPTLTRIYWTALEVLLVAMGSLIGALQTLRLGWWASAIVVLVAAIAGVFARRIDALRLAALCWLAGLGAAILLVATIALIRLIG